MTEQRSFLILIQGFTHMIDKINQTDSARIV